MAIKDIKFGTDGWRAIVGQEFNENNVDKVIEFVKYYEKNHKNTLLFTKKLWHSYFTDKNTITNALKRIINFFFIGYNFI